jgi:16S rRNA processing protein RimM
MTAKPVIGTDSSTAPGLWACGTVGRAHGLAGEFYLDLLPGGFACLSVGERFYLESPDSDASRPVVLERAGGTEQRPLVRLDGVATRDQVRELHGAVVLAAGARLDEGVDRYAVSELVGARVVTGGAELGVVADVLMSPAHDIIEVVAPDGARTLVPFVADLVEVDRERRLITVREGLLP